MFSTSCMGNKPFDICFKNAFCNIIGLVRWTADRADPTKSSDGKRRIRKHKLQQSLELQSTTVTIKPTIYVYYKEKFTERERNCYILHIRCIACGCVSPCPPHGGSVVSESEAAARDGGGDNGPCSGQLMRALWLGFININRGNTETIPTLSCRSGPGAAGAAARNPSPAIETEPGGRAASQHLQTIQHCYPALPTQSPSLRRWLKQKHLLGWTSRATSSTSSCN